MPGCSASQLATQGPLLHHETVTSGHTLRILHRSTAFSNFRSDAPVPDDEVDLLWLLRDAAGMKRAFWRRSRLENIDLPPVCVEIDQIPPSVFDAPMAFAPPISAVAWLEGDLDGGRDRLGYLVVGPWAEDASGSRGPTKGRVDSIAHGLSAPELLDVVCELLENRAYDHRAYLLGMNERGERGVLEVDLGRRGPRTRFTAMPGATHATSAAISAATISAVSTPRPRTARR